MLKKQKNRGVLFEPLDDEDYIFGSSELEDNITIDGDWTPYLVKGERQRQKLETMACVSFSALNCIEAIFNYHIANNMISDSSLEWLKAMEYMDGDEVNFSDRFLAVTSNTSKKGNTGKRVAQTMHEVGLVPEKVYPFPDTWDWKEYYKVPEPWLFDAANEFKERFLINYEVVQREDFKEALKHSPLQVYLYAWEAPVNFIYQRTDKQSNHAVQLHKGSWFVFDTYEKYDKFVKELAYDFRFSPIGYKYKLTEIKSMSNVKVLKDKDSNAVGFFLPAINSDAFRSLGANFGINVPLKDGSTDWDKVNIDGTYEIE